MLGVVLDGGKLSVRSDLPVPEPDPGEVRVRVRLAGICETDLQLLRGYMGFRGILGHEFVGVAETGKFAGERVVGEINCSCHVCETCLSGLPTHCPRRTVLGILGRNGAFAEYLVLPEANLHPVPDSLADEVAVFTEPVAAAFQIPARYPDLKGKRVVLLGDGRLGQLCAQVLDQNGARLLVVGKHARKLEQLRRMNFETALRDAAQPDRSADIVVDCTGSPSGFEDACRWVRPTGTIILKTTVAGRPELSLAPIVIDEVRVIGSRCGPFAPAIRALAEGSVQTRHLVDAEFPLPDAIEAFERVASRAVQKVLLRIPDSDAGIAH
jgi:threonine dehydrogenase-like Zn-dependent dehydrogenase